MKNENKISPALAKKLEKLRADAEKKVASQKEEDYSKEIEESRTLGKQQGMKYQEIEQCYKIAEEFKINPPILNSTHINGKLIEQHYEPLFAKKVEMLKRNNFSFNTAVHYTSIFGVVFGVLGKAYVKRGMQKIPLPENLEESTFLLKDGDILGTEKASYIFDIRESNDSDSSYTRITIFPKSELKISIEEKTTNPPPAFMEPSKASETIKRNSKSTVTNQKIKTIELVAGLFNVSIRREKSNVNNLLKISSSYPKITFKPLAVAVGNAIDDLMIKMKKQNAELAKKYEKIYSEQRDKALSTVCDNISGFIELCKDGSLVLIRSNIIRHDGIGKETKKMFTNPLKPIKITVTKNVLYETDTNKIPDGRVSGIIVLNDKFLSYIGALKAKKDYEERLSKSGNQSRPDSSVKQEAEDMMKYVKESGDKELIEVAKAQLKSAEDYIAGGGSAATENIQLNMLEKYKKQVDSLKPDIEAELPSYNSPSKSDAD